MKLLKNSTQNNDSRANSTDLTKIAFRQIFAFVALALGLSFFSGCATQEKDLNTPEGLFAHAKEFDEAERYDLAIQKYSDVRNKFPYSSFATDAELAVADVYFKRESYAEAQLSYQNFRDLHPKHPKIDYVIYQTAMSYYLQLPETIDRDLSPGTDAIYHFNEVIKLFPGSEFAKKATENKADTLKRLAEKELYIADYYLKQKQPAAALRRYEAMMKKYSGIGLDARAKYGAAMAAKGYDDKSKFLIYKSSLLKTHPDSTEAAAIRNEEM